MAGEPNQTKWRGIRPTNPEENIPVKQGTAADLNATVTPDGSAVFTVVETHLDQGSDSSTHSDPVANALLETTGQLVAGVYDFTFSYAIDVPHFYIKISHRNAADNDDLHRWFVCLTAFTFIQFYVNNWEIATNERMSVYMGGQNMTGAVAVTISWVKRS